MVWIVSQCLLLRFLVFCSLSISSVLDMCFILICLDVSLTWTIPICLKNLTGWPHTFSLFFSFRYVGDVWWADFRWGKDPKFFFTFFIAKHCFCYKVNFNLSWNSSFTLYIFIDIFIQSWKKMGDHILWSFHASVGWIYTKSNIMGDKVIQHSIIQQSHVK